MLDDYADMLAPALLMNGHKLNTENNEELKQAFGVLKQQSVQALAQNSAKSYACQSIS